MSRENARWLYLARHAEPWIVITHAFTIGWLVRHDLDAPAWRWFPPHQCHGGLTIIRYDAGSPPSVVVANDVAHLPAELRWTGFPEHLRP